MGPQIGFEHSGRRILKMARPSCGALVHPSNPSFLGSEVLDSEHKMVSPTIRSFCPVDLDIDMLTGKRLQINTKSTDASECDLAVCLCVPIPNLSYSVSNGNFPLIFHTQGNRNPTLIDAKVGNSLDSRRLLATEYNPTRLARPLPSKQHCIIVRVLGRSTADPNFCRLFFACQFYFILPSIFSISAR